MEGISLAARSSGRRTGPCRGSPTSSASGTPPPCRCHCSGVEAEGARSRERAISMAHIIPGTPSRGRDLVLGFLAGALAVVLFHQGMVVLLSTIGLIQSRVYTLQGVPPFGVPTILNQMFWGDSGACCSRRSPIRCLPGRACFSASPLASSGPCSQAGSWWPRSRVSRSRPAGCRSACWRAS